VVVNVYNVSTVRVYKQQVAQRVLKRKLFTFTHVGSRKFCG
jgi:hypothetical protein